MSERDMGVTVRRELFMLQQWCMSLIYEREKENPISLLIESSSAPNEKEKKKKKDDNKKGKNPLNDNVQGHPLKRSTEFEDKVMSFGTHKQKQTQLLRTTFQF